MRPDRRSSPLRSTTLAALAALLAAFTPSGAARAQELPPLAVEMRGGAALPVAGFRTGPDQGGEIGRAPTFGLHFVYRSSAGWGPYVGFSQHRFDCADDGCPGTEYVATTWDFAAQRTLGPWGWLRAGLLFGRMERDFPGEPETRRAASSLGMGAEAGAGLRIPLRGRMALTPGARIGWLNTRFPDHALMELRWIAADMGLAIGF